SFFFFSSRRRHTRSTRDWSSDVCSSDLYFVPARDFPAVDDSPNWKNFNLRLGVAYDLTGSGKTAIKASLGRFNPAGTPVANNNRSEERRVGKDGRSGCAA